MAPTSPIQQKEDVVVCDGPCGQKYAPDSMEVVGRCGHILCHNCHGLVYNDDGTQGCSNFNCVYATLYTFLSEELARKAYEENIMTRQRALGLPARQALAAATQPRSDLEPRRKRSLSIGRSPRARTPRGRRSGLLPLHRARANNVQDVPRTPESSRKKTESTSKNTTATSPPDKARRTRLIDEIFSDMSTATSNPECPTSEFELLHIRLMIFEPGPFKTIKRIHISREMSAALTVKEALDELIDKRIDGIRHECPSRLYFCPENKGEGLRRISVEEFESTRLCQYPARNSVLHFVLDAVGYLKSRGGD